MTPTWGGSNGNNFEIEKISFGKKKLPSTPKEDIEKIEKWIHEMTVYCETLPMFIINDQRTSMFKKVLNFKLSLFCMQNI